MWTGGTIMGVLEAFKLIKTNGLLNYQAEFEAQAKLLKIDLAKDYITYNEFVGFFSAPIFFAALSNLCHLLISNMKFAVEPLSIRINNYQRKIYESGLKEGNRLKDGMKEVLKANQELLKQNYGCNDLNEYLLQVKIGY